MVSCSGHVRPYHPEINQLPTELFANNVCPLHAKYRVFFNGVETDCIPLYALRWFSRLTIATSHFSANIST